MAPHWRINSRRDQKGSSQPGTIIPTHSSLHLHSESLVQAPLPVFRPALLIATMSPTIVTYSVASPPHHARRPPPLRSTHPSAINSHENATHVAHACRSRTLRRSRGRSWETLREIITASSPHQLREVAWEADCTPCTHTSPRPRSLESKHEAVKIWTLTSMKTSHQLQLEQQSRTRLRDSHRRRGLSLPAEFNQRMIHPKKVWGVTAVRQTRTIVHS